MREMDDPRKTGITAVREDASTREMRHLEDWDYPPGLLPVQLFPTKFANCFLLFPGLNIDLILPRNKCNVMGTLINILVHFDGYRCNGYI